MRTTADGWAERCLGWMRRGSQFPSERAAKDNWIWCWYLPAATCSSSSLNLMWFIINVPGLGSTVSSFAICLEALPGTYVAKEWHMTFFNLPLYYKLFGEKMTSCGNILIELQCLSVALRTALIRCESSVYLHCRMNHARLWNYCLP